MIWTLQELFKQANTVSAEIGGKWVPKRPDPGPLKWRLQAAWAVLRGRADAFRWPEGQ